MLFSRPLSCKHAANGCLLQALHIVCVQLQAMGGTNVMQQALTAASRKGRGVELDSCIAEALPHTCPKRVQGYCCRLYSQYACRLQITTFSLLPQPLAPWMLSGHAAGCLALSSHGSWRLRLLLLCWSTTPSKACCSMMARSVCCKPSSYSTGGLQGRHCVKKLLEACVPARCVTALDASAVYSSMRHGAQVSALVQA